MPTDDFSPIASREHTRIFEDRHLTQSQPQTQFPNDDSVFSQDHRDGLLLLNKGANLHKEQTRHNALFSSTTTSAANQNHPVDTNNAQISSLPSESVKDDLVVEPASPKVASSTAPRTFVPSSPSSPVKHTRVPSTGNRATVMEVAQALLDHPAHDHISKDIDIGPKTIPNLDREPSLTAEAIPKPRPLFQIQAEKRKSSYEKYSAIILPSLKEEATPTPSPAGTLTRIEVKVERDDVKNGTELDTNSSDCKSTLQEPRTFASQGKFDILYPYHCFLTHVYW